MKYGIKSGEIGSDALWSVVDTQTGEVMAAMHGPMSGAACLAACEALNNKFQWDGWTARIAALTVNQTERAA